MEQLKKTNANKRTVIIGSGRYIPSRVIPNEAFLSHIFYDSDGNILDRPNEEIIRKFGDITGIRERRYVTEDLVASDIAFFSAQEAIQSSGIDQETLDCIIVAHNFGDIRIENRRSEFVPTLASRVKYRLGIKNPLTVCYDLPFGCAGWLQGMIQADHYIRSGENKRVLVIGAETLSRIADPHDRDSMLYADGAGAAVVESQPNDKPVGILSYCSHTYAEHAYVLKMARSNNPEYHGNELFLKMQGRVLYEQALKSVPNIVYQSLERAGVSLKEVQTILIHQANAKMMEAIVKRLYQLYEIESIPKQIMPTTISWLGNSSVATLPTLYDLLAKGELENHELKSGNIILFISMGAGVNINAIVYRVPD